MQTAQKFQAFSINPLHIMLAGLVGVLLFVLLLLGIIHWVVSGTTPG